jgi:hypothetical protein
MKPAEFWLSAGCCFDMHVGTAQFVQDTSLVLLKELSSYVIAAATKIHAFITKASYVHD